MKQATKRCCFFFSLPLFLVEKASDLDGILQQLEIEANAIQVYRDTNQILSAEIRSVNDKLATETKK